MAAPPAKTCVILGFGAVGTRVAELLLRQLIPGLKVVGVSDSSGGTANPDGLDLRGLLDHKEHEGVASYEGGTPHEDSAALYDALASPSGRPLDLVVDLSPVDLTSGGPSLPILRRALAAGTSCVLANKAPLVLDYKGLHEAAHASKSKLAFSATVCGGLPVVNVGVRDLRGATFERVEGIFNSTTNYILAEMEAGRSRAEALAEAQRVGIAEADPRLDVDGFDTANKLVIVANAVLGQAATLDDVSVRGISEVTDAEVLDALREGDCIRLVARAVPASAPATASSAASSAAAASSFTLTVGPERVKRDGFLGNCAGTSMCCRYVTDIFETIDLCTNEKGVWPTAAAVCRDCYDILYA